MRAFKRIKRSTKQYIIVALICILVIGGAAAFTSIIITGQIREEYQELLKKANDELKANQRYVYIVTEKIASGEVIKRESVQKKTVYSSQPQDSYITDEDIGKTALVSIPGGTQILKTMVTDHKVSPKLRETEYQVISVNSNISKNDTVDIRLLYPNGESYVVLSKKEIKAYTPETSSIFLWLEEDELLRMSAAIVDAGLYSGAKLYVTKYIEPNIQAASIITYTPSLSILSLIEDDPNIMERCSQKLNKEIRKALENRLADSLSTDVSAIRWEVDSKYPVVAGTPESEQITKVPDVSESEPETKVPDGSEIDKTDGAISPAPTSFPINERESGVLNNDNELGSENYFYYAQNSTGNDKMEYGE